MWYTSRSGEVNGPYTEQQLRAMASSGALTADMLICREGEQWSSAAESTWLYEQPQAMPRVYSSPQSPASLQTGRPVVIEKTSKTWKALMLLGVAAIISGLALMREPAITHTDPKILQFAPHLVFGGIATIVFARLGAWWNHG